MRQHDSLKPVRRRVWAPIGEQPVALGHHRFQWLYVTAFVAPSSGETVWYLSNGIDKRLFELMLAELRPRNRRRPRADYPYDVPESPNRPRPMIRDGSESVWELDQRLILRMRRLAIAIWVIASETPTRAS